MLVDPNLQRAASDLMGHNQLESAQIPSRMVRRPRVPTRNGAPLGDVMVAAGPVNGLQNIGMTTPKNSIPSPDWV